MADDTADAGGLPERDDPGQSEPAIIYIKRDFRWNPRKPWIGFSPVWSGARF